LYPEQGQTTLFFHSVKLTLAIRQNQRLLVDRLSSLRRRGANGRWNSYFSANILRKLRNAVDRPEQPTTGHLRYWSSSAWGAVPLLLRYVDPDLLILLLPPEVRRDLAQEVDAWQKFVHRTLTELLSYPNAKLPDTHILRNPNSGVRKRGERAPEGQELAQSLEKTVGISHESISEPVGIVELDGFISIPESHLALLEKIDPEKARLVKEAKATLPARYRPQPGIFYLSEKDKHLFAPNTPLLPSKMLTKAEGNEGSRIEYDEDLKEMVIRDYTEADIGRAINELVSRQCKILRHALENARLLKEELIAPDAIVALTVSELSRELRQIIDDQLRELARKRARPEEVNDQPKANELDAKLKQILSHTEDLKLRAAVDELLTLRKNIPDKTRAPKEYERLRKQRYRLWERIKKIQMTVTSNDKKNEASPTVLDEIEALFAEEQTKVSLQKRAAYNKGHN
jgi:hypothetical protein